MNSKFGTYVHKLLGVYKFLLHRASPLDPPMLSEILGPPVEFFFMKLEVGRPGLDLAYLVKF